MKSLHTFAYVIVWITFFFSGFFSSAIIAQHSVGNTTITFQDPTRGNRSIETAIYYPATSAGTNTPAVQDSFPVIIFGHGFAMEWTAYQNLWEHFVPGGYIMAFPKTESSLFSTDHQAFGWDLQYLVGALQSEGANMSSVLYNVVASETALMGHSMGGGAAFLAADSLSQNNSPLLKGLVGFAPAESTTNGVSSINSARSITVPGLVLSGSQDGVTPPADHHIPMYDSLASSCKTFLNIQGGAHCYYANSNFNCDLGEATASTGISISRADQQAVTYDFVDLWLDYYLKGDCLALNTFQDSLQNSSRISFNQSCGTNPCTPLSIRSSSLEWEVQLFPNPSRGHVTIVASDLPRFQYQLMDVLGQVHQQGVHTGTTALELSVQELSSGIYWMKISYGGTQQTIKLIKE